MDTGKKNNFFAYEHGDLEQVNECIAPAPEFKHNGQEFRHSLLSYFLSII